MLLRLCCDCSEQISAATGQARSSLNNPCQALRTRYLHKELLSLLSHAAAGATATAAAAIAVLLVDAQAEL